MVNRESELKMCPLLAMARMMDKRSPSWVEEDGIAGKRFDSHCRRKK